MTALNHFEPFRGRIDPTLDSTVCGFLIVYRSKFACFPKAKSFWPFYQWRCFTALCCCPLRMGKARKSKINSMTQLKTVGGERNEMHVSTFSRRGRCAIVCIWRAPKLSKPVGCAIRESSRFLTLIMVLACWDHLPRWRVFPEFPRDFLRSRSLRLEKKAVTHKKFFAWMQMNPVEKMTSEGMHFMNMWLR